MAIPRDNTETLALEQFREVVPDLDFDDGTLMRFLRARNLDIDKAENMIRNSINWRKENEINALQFWDTPEEIVDGYDLYHMGFDKENRPVFYAPLGMWTSSRDLFAKGMEQDCLQYAAKAMDMVHRQLLKTNHQNFVCIVDNTGVTIRKATYEIQNLAGIQDLIRLFRDYESNFPETLHKAFVINTPSAFYWGFNIVKPLMSGHTLNKINIFDTDASKWKPALFDSIPSDAIPVKFGGTGKGKSFYPMKRPNAV